MKRGILSLFFLPLVGLAQIDQRSAVEAFNHAKTLCELEGGNLWKTSLCGQIVIADPRPGSQARRGAQSPHCGRRFVEGPILILPRGSNASFLSAGMTPLSGEGTVYLSYRTRAEWGRLEAWDLLVDADRGKLTIPAPPVDRGQDTQRRRLDCHDRGGSGHPRSPSSR